jgi:hypothetical protein
LEEDFTIIMEVPVSSLFKAKAKQRQFLKQISEVLSRQGVRNIIHSDFGYVDRRSGDAIHEVVITLQVIAPIVSIPASSLSLARWIWQMNEKARIMLERKDGSFVELTDRMIEKEVNDALKTDRNRDEGGKTKKTKG